MQESIFEAKTFSKNNIRNITRVYFWLFKKVVTIFVLSVYIKGMVAENTYLKIN